MQHSTDTPIDQIIMDRTLDLQDAENVVLGKLRLSLSPKALSRCRASHDRLCQAIKEERHIYGLTTGFGPLANRLVDRSAGMQLQQNLVYHLATGVGPWFDWASGRAIVLARLMSVLQGASGASEPAIHALVTLLNSSLSPCMPSKGTVGASGDLTPLAHMVLCFQARGAFRTPSGEVLEGEVGLSSLGLKPLTLERRDGLALVNGTSAMTGIAVLNAMQANRAIDWAITLTAAFAETQNARVEAWHPEFALLRPHPGQITVTKQLCDAIAGSQRVNDEFLSTRSLKNTSHRVEALAGQDAYTLRCAPQVIGAVRDTADWHNQVTQTELCSATDNPIFPDGTDLPIALHGGNFMGQHLSLASDALANAISVLAGLAERQIARITDELLNRGLPAFLHEGSTGLNSGFMGAQVTATALLAEMRAIGTASTQSISTNGANQDVVSMGTIAARLLQIKLTALMQIQSIMALCLAQAIDLQSSNKAASTFTPNSLALRDFVRSFSNRLTEDRPLGDEIETLAFAMSRHCPPKAKK